MSANQGINGLGSDSPQGPLLTRDGNERIQFRVRQALTLKKGEARMRVAGPLAETVTAPLRAARLML